MQFIISISIQCGGCEASLGTHREVITTLFPGKLDMQDKLGKLEQAILQDLVNHPVEQCPYYGTYLPQERRAKRRRSLRKPYQPWSDGKR